LLVSTINTQVSFPVCPVVLSTFWANGFPNQILVLMRHLRACCISSWKAYGFVMAERSAGGTIKRTTTVPAFSWIGDCCFSVLKYENTVGAEIDATWFSSFGVAIAFI